MGNEGIVQVAMLLGYRQLRAQAPQGTAEEIDNGRFVVKENIDSWAIYF